MKNFEEPEIVTLFCCVLQHTWRQFGPSVSCLFVNISGRGQCGRKRKKEINLTVLEVGSRHQNGASGNR